MLRRKITKKPAKLHKKSLSIFGRRPKKITAREICVFSRQLATLIKSGVPLLQSFEIVARGHNNPGMQDMLMSIKLNLEVGNSLSESLRNYPKYFDKLFCNLVSVGEQSGSLETMLDRIASYKEKIETIKSKVKKVMFYPLAVTIVALVISSILLLWVVPQFQQLFASFGAQLPAFTRMVLSLSWWLQSFWWLLCIIIIGAIIGFKQALKTSENFAYRVDSYMLRFYIIGDIFSKSAIARFARTLSTTFAAGVPLLDALKTVSDATGNRVYSKAIKKIGEGVANGQQLHLAMRKTGVFPNMVVQMVAIGEEAGSLDNMLSKVADFYEQEVDDKVDALSSLLEPVTIVVLGALIGGMIVAMYLPIFQIGGSLG